MSKWPAGLADFRPSNHDRREFVTAPVGAPAPVREDGRAAIRGLLGMSGTAVAAQHTDITFAGAEKQREWI